jgi:hypothetical protein
MSEDKEGRIFGAVEVTEEYAGQDWRALEREELLRRTIIALDGAKMEAEEEAGDENYARHVRAVLFPFLETELKKVRGEADSRMTEEERALYDAQADCEAWCFAKEILDPWVKVAHLIGSGELVQVMEKARAGSEAEVGRTMDVLRGLRKNGEA